MRHALTQPDGHQTPYQPNTVASDADCVPCMCSPAGTWYHAGYHLATTIATPAAYAPLPWAFAMLTWPGGIIAFVIGTAVTWYNR